MLFVNTPSRKERQLLVSYHKQGPSTLVRARAQAIIMSHRGVRVPDIAETVFYARRTVRQWINEWNARRLSSIFQAYDGNENAAKLTATQKDEIKTVLGSPPRDDRLPSTFWTLPKLQQYVSTTFGVIYESPQSYYYLLQHCGFSFKRPSPFDRRRDDAFVKKRMKEIHREIKPFLDHRDWEVFVQDESRLDWEEETRRAWLKRGEKTVVKLERNKRAAQSYFGALNQRSGVHHLIELDWQDTDNIIRGLVTLSKEYPGKKLCIVWDNARWHKSKALREQLAAGRQLGHVHLINLPPYAPDENPEEHVWKEGKEAVANRHFGTFEALKDAFRQAITRRTFNYKMC